MPRESEKFVPQETSGTATPLSDIEPGEEVLLPGVDKNKAKAAKEKAATKKYQAKAEAEYKSNKDETESRDVERMLRSREVGDNFFEDVAFYFRTMSTVTEKLPERFRSALHKKDAVALYECFADELIWREQNRSHIPKPDTRYSTSKEATHIVHTAEMDFLKRLLDAYPEYDTGKRFSHE